MIFFGSNHEYGIPHQPTRGIRMNGVDYDEAKVFFKRIYSRIEEQESLGRKMFKDEADKEAWAYLMMYFEAGPYEKPAFDPLDWDEEENDIF